MNPLLFMPSPRDIPAVKKLWHKLPYDKLIVKYMTEKAAYQTAQQYFKSHIEYTHIVICPDDLEIYLDLLKDMFEITITNKLQTLTGFANIDESQPDVFDLWIDGTNLDAEKPPSTKGSMYTESTLPTVDIRHFDHCGGACRIISRSLFDKLSFDGGNPTKDGFFDWQISRELKQLNVTNHVYLKARFYHRRTEQKPVNDAEHCYYYILN